VAYERSGYGPQDVHLGVKLLVDESTVLTGRIPVNSSGGLISMGHPLGLPGLGQIAEILWQMRRTAGSRQIPQDVHVALAHMVGAGGVCVIHILRR
jgi:acetyl-CoA acetyltransferase